MNQTSDSTYQGPGRWVGMFGGGRIGALIGAAVAITLAFVFPGISLVAQSLIALGSSLVGSYVGYEKAIRGERQFHQMQAKLQATQAHLAEHTMEPQVAQTRFTDRIPSRGVQGSYVDAVNADRAQAATAEQTR